MDRRRAGLAVALLLVAGLARAATQGPPVYAYTGAAPSGSCTGTRVWIDALGSGTYYCNAGTWAAVAPAQALKARGFRFCGPTITYAFMQANGLVNDHVQGCYLSP